MDETLLTGHLLALEERLLERSAEDIAELLADDFSEIGRSGRTWTKEQVIEAIADGTRLEATITNFRVRRLAPDVALATFRTVEAGGMNQALRSSIWRQDRGRWQMVFHQGTPTVKG